MNKMHAGFAPCRRWKGTLLWVIGSALAACGGGASDTGDALAAAASPTPPKLAATLARATLPGTTYTVVNLDPANASGFPVINANNQVAFSVVRDAVGRAGFFNGDRVRDIGNFIGSVGGNFGGAEWSATGLNDAGQVIGTATNADHAMRGFRWSEAGGVVSLGTLGAAALHPAAINRLGQVAGWVDPGAPDGDSRAFFWRDGAGARDLGALGSGGATAEAINDAGIVAGRSPAADGVNHAFAWSAAGGMVDLGIGGGVYSTAHLINKAGQIGGLLRVPGGDLAFHGFVWSRASGIRDIGTLGGDYSFLAAINDAGQVAGVSHPDCDQCFHAITWSAADGLVDLGTLGGTMSNAFGINRHGEVVGWAESDSVSSRNFHAFVWIKGQGMVDLNDRIPNAPAGLELTSALAISDSGAIVAESTAGLVLLLPGANGTDAPLVGPLTPSGPVMAGTVVAFAASFSDRNSADKHSATWSWHDGCGLDAVSKVQRPGTLRANHTFCAPGEYWVSLAVTDSSGRTTTVGHTVMVF